MLKTTLLLSTALTLGSVASAQTSDASGLLPIQSAARHGGTFHVVTGTWTRTTSQPVQRGVNDVVYNNTSNVDFFTSGGIGLQTNSFQFVDEGRIPSTGSAGTANRDNYNLNQITIGYCINNNTASAIDVEISIYGSYIPCTDPGNAVCSGAFVGTGLPGATAADIALGYATCWTIELDLSGGAEICILGDGDGVLDGDLDFDSFGIGMEFDPGGAGGYVGSGFHVGPMLAGDRRWTVQAIGALGGSAGSGVPGCPITAAGSGGDTYYGPAECCVPTLGGDNSTGLDSQDFNWTGDRLATLQPAGCFFFGGYRNPTGCNADGGIFTAPNSLANPPSNLYNKIEADQSSACVPTFCVPNHPPGTSFCDPANNNSSGGPAVLSGNFGSGFETGLHLDVSGGPLPLANGTRMLGYFLVGNTATVGIPISDGNFCLVGTGGTFDRYNVTGTTRFSIGLFDAAGNLENLVGTGGTSGYGFDVPFAVHLPGQAPTTIMAGDTYHFQAWFRDTLSGPGHSNFTNGLTVTF